MRNFYFLLVLIIAFFLTACAQAESPVPCVNKLRRWHPPEDEEKYYGRVKSVQIDEQIFEFETHFIYEHDAPLPKRHIEFDESGRLVQENDYRLDGESLPSTSYEYDENGFLVAENALSALTKQPLLETRYSYNANGTNKEIVQTSLDNNKVYSRWTITGDSNGSYSDIREVESETSGGMHMGITRDERCRVSKIYALTPYVRIPIGSTSFSYDERDNPISVKQYLPAGILWGQRKMEYEFDENGNWIKRSDYALKYDQGVSEWKLMNVNYRKVTYFDAK